MAVKNHIALCDRTPENDIKYKAPLSYRYARLIAWICIALVQVATLMGFEIYLCQSDSPNMAATLKAWSDVLSVIGSGAVPLFLLANFALILQSRESVVKTVLMHLACAIGIALAFILVYRRYLYGYLSFLFADSAPGLIDGMVKTILSSHLNFNIFIDLLICSSSYFFMVYHPRKVFTGKKLIIFRLFTLIPALYEIACCIIMGLSNGLGLFTIPVILSPFFTTKPFMTYLAFFFIILYAKHRKKHFLSLGKSEEDYKRFLKTNANSFSVSLFITGVFLIVGLLDLVCSIGGCFIGASIVNDETLTASEVMSQQIAPLLNSWGIGKNIDLLIGAPIVLLFSYTKKHKAESKNIDIILPIAGIILCVLVYLEGGLAILGSL